MNQFVVLFLLKENKNKKKKNEKQDVVLKISLAEIRNLDKKFKLRFDLIKIVFLFFCNNFPLTYSKKF